MVDDGDYVGQALSGPRSRRENVVASLIRRPDGLLLVSVKPKGRPGIFGAFFPSEYLLALGVKQILPDEVADVSASLKGRVELNEGIRPEKTPIELRFDFVADPIISD